MGEIKETLQKHQFKFNKQFGQNFITDGNLLSAIVADAGITSDDVVVEIGTGAGTLTACLARVAKKVITFEIDYNLRDVLEETLAEFNNIEVHFGDFQKVSEADLLQLTGGNFKVVANLPYYITTPLIMRFLEGDFLPQSITVMVQKEVAERLVSKPDTQDYGLITVSVGVCSDVAITRIVGRKMFYPPPNVDSAVVRFDIVAKYDKAQTKKIKTIAKHSFTMRRKTLVNNLVGKYNLDKPQLVECLERAGLGENVRGEALGIEQFARLANIIEEAKSQ